MSIEPTVTLTTDEARKILGNDANNMSDEEIQQLVTSLNSLARSFVQSVLNGDAYAVLMEYNRGN